MRSFTHDQYKQQNHKSFPILIPLHLQLFRLPRASGGGGRAAVGGGLLPSLFPIAFFSPLNRNPHQRAPRRPDQPFDVRLRDVPDPSPHARRTRGHPRIRIIQTRRRGHRKNRQRATSHPRTRSPRPRNRPPRRHPQRQTHNPSPRRNPTQSRHQNLIFLYSGGMGFQPVIPNEPRP